MKIKVTVFGGLQVHPTGQTKNRVEIELPAGTTVRDLLQQLRVPDRPGVVAAAQGRILGENDRLAPGAEISLLPPACGG